jgi:hypothetical protein
MKRWLSYDMKQVSKWRIHNTTTSQVEPKKEVTAIPPSFDWK